MSFTNTGAVNRLSVGMSEKPGIWQKISRWENRRPLARVSGMLRYAAIASAKGRLELQARIFIEMLSGRSASARILAVKSSTKPAAGCLNSRRAAGIYQAVTGL